MWVNEGTNEWTSNEQDMYIYYMWILSEWVDECPKIADGVNELVNIIQFILVMTHMIFTSSLFILTIWWIHVVYIYFVHYLFIHLFLDSLTFPSLSYSFIHLFIHSFILIVSGGASQGYIVEIVVRIFSSLLVPSFLPSFTHISISFILIHSTIHSFFHPYSQWWGQPRLYCGNRGPIMFLRYEVWVILCELFAEILPQYIKCANS